MRSFFFGRVDGHGTVSNLSLNGCQIQSSCLVRPDTYLTLLLSLPDVPQPLKINVAVVRWNRPKVCDVEFDSGSGDSGAARPISVDTESVH